MSHRLEPECAAVRTRVSALPVAEALASPSPNTAVRHEPPSVVFEKLRSLHADLRGRRCLLAPSMHARPHLFVRVGPGYPAVAHFPVEGDRSRNTLAQVRLRLAILAAPARLSLCRHVVNEPATTSDLAARTGMTAPPGFPTSAASTSDRPSTSTPRCLSRCRSRRCWIIRPGPAGSAPGAPSPARRSAAIGWRGEGWSNSWSPGVPSCSASAPWARSLDRRRSSPKSPRQGGVLE
ncbi:DUF5937 family protein [Amycolatopsis sp. NPDC051045]|uniref:DUF5937 family protein n=1 Tax=Amycolatopsis sp. NPDC051045 TaxID=3156922 RepID=UPI003431DD40